MSVVRGNAEKQQKGVVSGEQCPSLDRDPNPPERDPNPPTEGDLNPHQRRSKSTKRHSNPPRDPNPHRPPERSKPTERSRRPKRSKPTEGSMSVQGSPVPGQLLCVVPVTPSSSGRFGSMVPLSLSECPHGASGRLRRVGCWLSPSPSPRISHLWPPRVPLSERPLPQQPAVGMRRGVRLPRPLG